MDLQFINSVIRKSRYENEANPAQLKGMKMPISVNLELVYPNAVREGSVFLLPTRTAVGNPITKFYIFVEQVCSFKVVDLEEGFDTSRENMQKFISLICHPIALREMQSAMDSLTSLYRIPGIRLPKSTEGGGAKGNPVVDMSGKGILN